MAIQQSESIDEDELSSMGRVTVLAMQGLRLLELGECQGLSPLQREETLHSSCEIVCSTFRSTAQSWPSWVFDASSVTELRSAEAAVRNQVERIAGVAAEGDDRCGHAASGPDDTSEWTVVQRQHDKSGARGVGKQRPTQTDQGNRQSYSACSSFHAKHEGRAAEEKRLQNRVQFA